jgi:TonB family protein
MTRSRLIFFLVVLAIVIAIWRAHPPPPASKTASNTPPPAPVQSATAIPARNNSLIIPAAQSPATTATASAAVAQAPHVDFKKPAQRITPAVLALSIFDSTGKLLRNGTGFFVSSDGKIVTSRSIVDGGSHAVATSSDGKSIFNVTGVLSEAAPSDVAVLQAQLKEKEHVPFITPNKTAPFDAGARIAAVGSPQNKKEDMVAETAISGRRSDNNSEWLELTRPVPGDSLGAPVITEKGDVLGFIALQRGNGPAIDVVRMASALESVFARIDEKKQPSWVAVSPDAPAEGPSASPTPVVKKHIVYNPFPRYPAEARRFFNPVTGSGRYRIHFAKDGTVHDVAIVQSAQNQALDNAAVQALRTWRAEPGGEWTAYVPITFQP